MSVAPSGAAQPLYQQIKTRILARIDGGEWAPGRRIPSENQLVRALGVSRMTVHRALRELAHEGRLERVPGVGTFVAEPPRHASLIELRNIADEIRAQGGRHQARVVRRERVALDGTIADRMARAPGEPVAHVTLVHARDELPIQLEDRFVDLTLVPDFLDVDFTAITPSEHLLTTIRPDEMEHVVRAVMPDPSTCSHLAISPDEPCLTLSRRTWHGGRVVTCADLTYPSSRFALDARYTLHDPAHGGPSDPGDDTPSLLPAGYRRKPRTPDAP